MPYARRLDPICEGGGIDERHLQLLKGAHVEGHRGGHLLLEQRASGQSESTYTDTLVGPVGETRGVFTRGEFEGRFGVG